MPFMICFAHIKHASYLPSLMLLESLANSLGTKPSVIYAAAEEMEAPDQAKSDQSLLSLDFSEDALNVRVVFRELTKTNQRIAVELLRALKRTQS